MFLFLLYGFGYCVGFVEGRVFIIYFVELKVEYRIFFVFFVCGVGLFGLDYIWIDEKNSVFFWFEVCSGGYKGF